MKRIIVFALSLTGALISSADEISSAVASTFAGKTAVITGAASGMGLCTSKTLAEAGCLCLQRGSTAGFLEAGKKK